MLVNKERLLKEFETLVSFDSESYEERKIADYLIQRLQALGLDVMEDNANHILKEEGILQELSKSAGNVFGILKGKRSGDGILFSSHMDTVKPGKGKKVIFHENGKITSDGTTILGADDAGGLAAILEALTVIKEEGLEHVNIEVLFPIAEEDYAQGSRIFDYTRISAKLAYVFDLSGEIGTAALAAPTVYSFQIRIYGKSAHAGFCPQDGIHAIHIASMALQQFQNGWGNDATSVNFGTINGGIAHNIVPDFVEITGEVRSLEHKNALKKMEQIQQIFEQIAKEFGGKADVKSNVGVHAYRIDEEEEVVQRYLKACANIGIEFPELIQTLGGSDNNYLVFNGVRGIVVASAMQNVHTTHEYTTQQDLVKSAQLVLQLATL